MLTHDGGSKRIPGGGSSPTCGNESTAMGLPFPLLASTLRMFLVDTYVCFDDTKISYCAAHSASEKNINTCKTSYKTSMFLVFHKTTDAHEVLAQPLLPPYPRCQTDRLQRQP
jgi:hypothetical protein